MLQTRRSDRVDHEAQLRHLEAVPLYSAIKRHLWLSLVMSIWMIVVNQHVDVPFEANL